MSRNRNRRIRTISQATALLAFFGVLGLLATGCERAVEDSVGIDRYMTTFDSAQEADNWKQSEDDPGQWEIRDGWLVGTAPADLWSVLWLDRVLARDLIVEFDAECVDYPADLNCFICGNGKNYSGYEFVVGGFRHMDVTQVAIYKARMEGEPMERRRLVREPFSLEKNRVYTIKVIKDDGKLRLYVDDELLINEIDPEPIDDPANRYFAFSTFHNRVRFDNLRIRRRD